MRPYYEPYQDEDGRPMYQLHLQYSDTWGNFGEGFKKSEKYTMAKIYGEVPGDDEEVGFKTDKPIIFYKKQFEIFFGNHKLGLLEGSTKSGKTFAAQYWLIYQALNVSDARKSEFIWAAPTQAQAQIVYDDFENLYLADIAKKGLCKFTKDPYPEVLFCNGSRIRFVPASPENLMGNGIAAIVIDEASLCKDKIWKTIMSITFQTGGLIRMLGNVISSGNWWNKICKDKVILSQSRVKYERLTIYDALAGGVIKQSDVDFVKAMHRHEPHVFEALYLCNPGDDGGNPFGESKIDNVTMPWFGSPMPVAFGVDVAKSRDYTVIIGLNKLGEMCYYRRFNKKDWDVMNEIIVNSVGKEPYTCLDTTGLGEQTKDYVKDRINLVDDGFVFSANAKRDLIADLIYGIHSGVVKIVDDYAPGMEAPDGTIVEEEICVKKELLAFGYKRNAMGQVSYEAQSGHDDTVMALALAFRAYKQAEADGMLDKNYNWGHYEDISYFSDSDYSMFDKYLDEI